jgi:hypothetical protein
MQFSELRQKLSEIRSKTPSWVPSVVRRSLILVVSALIFWQIWNIGWDEVLRNLPSTPWFYIIAAILYVMLPTTELLIYTKLWNVKKRMLFRTFLIKRVYNEEVLGYSGELYLFSKMRKITRKPELELMRDVRDTNIISAIVSNVVAISLVAFLIFFGFIPVEKLLEQANWLYVGIGSFAGIVIIALAVQFRRHIFSLPFKTAFHIFWTYLIRFVLQNALLVVQWAVVLPDTPIYVWLIYISTSIVLNRIPLLPAKDLVFVWIGIQLSGSLDVATAGLAGMLIVSSAMSRVANLIIYITLSKSKSGDVIPKPDC